MGHSRGAVSVVSVLAVLAAVALAACSGGARPSSPGAAASTAGAGAPASQALTEAECMKLLDHYLELAMAEKRASLPAEQVPTPEQVAHIRATMRDAAREECVGRAERRGYDCAMRAETTRAIGACMGEAPRGG